MSIAALALLASTGCSKKKPEHESSTGPVKVDVTHPEVRTIVRTVGQPSFVESYERTSIYPKVIGYIEEWNVDIGDRVKKDEVLGTLFVPELVEDLGTKKATVELDKERIDQALKIVDVAVEDVAAADARLEEARSILAKYQAQVDRWDSEVDRLTREVKKGVVDPQVLLESTNQLKSSTAARDAADAAIRTAEAELLSKKATLAKDNVDVAVAKADLAVAESEARRLSAWVGYLTLPAPYDGVIVARNANTGDFVLPLAGDPTAMQRAPYLAPGAKAAPIYVIERLDVVRIFIDIPERDANYVQVGTKASVLIEAFRDDWIPAEVTRTSWALNVTSRTLRAEIDLTNTESPKPYWDTGGHPIDTRRTNGEKQMLPNMYAYARVTIERTNVRALPKSALERKGGRNYFWRCDDDNKARRFEVQTAVTDGHWVEVTRRRRASKEEETDTQSWSPIDGTEQVILGDLTLLTEGAEVSIKPKKSSKKDSSKDGESQDGKSKEESSKEGKGKSGGASGSGHDAPPAG